MNGVIEGGWEYVYAAYIVVMGGLSLYGITLVSRLHDVTTMLADHKRQQLAGRSRRWANFLIDHVIIGLLVFLMIRMDTAISAGLWLGVKAVLIYIVYYMVCETILGRTPAKFLTGTMVTTTTGGKANPVQILSRTLLRLVPVDPLSFLVSDSGWHDKLSETQVVRKTSDDSNPTP